LELFGQRGNILWSKKRKLSLPKEKKYSYDGCLQEKTSSKQQEQLFFFETSNQDGCEKKFPPRNKKNLKKRYPKGIARFHETGLRPLLCNNKHSTLLRTKFGHHQRIEFVDVGNPKKCFESYYIFLPHVSTKA